MQVQVKYRLSRNNDGRVKANSVPYDIWEKQGYIMSTEGNVIHYDFIEKFIMDLSEKYHILEIAVDRWNATHVIQNLEETDSSVYADWYKEVYMPTITGVNTDAE